MKSDELGRNGCWPFLSRLWRPVDQVISFLDEYPLESLDDLPRVARKMGCHIRSPDLGPGVEGLTLGTYIFLNRSSDEETRNFTLAHEIGHYWMHTLRGSTDEKDVEDIDASLFATFLVQSLSDPKLMQKVLTKNSDAHMILVGSCMASAAALAIQARIFIGEKVADRLNAGVKQSVC